MTSTASDIGWLEGTTSGGVVGYAEGDLAWSDYERFLRHLIVTRDIRAVCEVGGGANPMFPRELINERSLDYVIMDISQEELDKAPAGYRKVRADIVEDRTRLDCQFDLVFSKMLAEHVSSGEAFHRNVARLLRPGGIAVHFFPTLFAPPFVLNALLPERLAESVLHYVQTGRERSGKRAKFPAYYSWCRGPTRKQIALFEGLGFEVERYIGFFGHAGYYRKVPALERLHRRFSAWLVKHPIPQVSSFAWVVLRKVG